MAMRQSKVSALGFYPGARSQAPRRLKGCSVSRRIAIPAAALVLIAMVALGLGILGTHSDSWVRHATTLDAPGWRTATVDEIGNVGYYNSIAVDSHDCVHIAYIDHTPATSDDHLKWATNAGGYWKNYTLTSGFYGVYYAWPSIAVYSNDSVHISFCQASGVRYTMNEPDAPWRWHSSSVDSIGHNIDTSIELDSNGCAHICYLDLDSGEINYATNEAGSWTVLAVDSVGDIGLGCDIARDLNEITHICYQDYWGDFDLKYATNASGVWESFTLDSTDDVGAYPSIAVDSSGIVHISYYDMTNDDLKYATNWGGSWAYLTLDSAEIVGACSSICVDSNDNVHISYLETVDGSSYNLKYATDAGGLWEVYTVDSSGIVGWTVTSIAADSNGYAHTSYYDSVNDNLMYATNSPPPEVHEFGTVGVVIVAMATVCILVALRRSTEGGKARNL